MGDSSTKIPTPMYGTYTNPFNLVIDDDTLVKKILDVCKDFKAIEDDQEIVVVAPNVYETLRAALPSEMAWGLFLSNLPSIDVIPDTRANKDWVHIMTRSNYEIWKAEIDLANKQAKDKFSE